MCKSRFINVSRKLAAFCLFISFFFTPVFSTVSFASEQKSPSGESVPAKTADADSDVSGGDIAFPVAEPVKATFYVLRENLARPEGESWLNWNGYWRVGYGSVTAGSNVYDDPVQVQDLLTESPSSISRVGEGQHVEWYTIRYSGGEWRVEGQIVSDYDDAALQPEPSEIQNALFYLLKDNMERPQTSGMLSRSAYYTQLGYGTVNAPAEIVNDDEAAASHIVYAPDCSSYLKEGESVTWYLLKNRSGVWEVDGEIVSAADTPKESTATFYLLADGVEKPLDDAPLNWSDYRRIGYGSVTDTEIIPNDSEKVGALLGSVPDCSSYLKEGEYVDWYALRTGSDSTVWRVDGVVVNPASNEIKTSDFIHVNGSEIVDSSGAPYQIKGIGFGNNVWYTQWQLPTTDHDEESYAELAELGFNSVRFYLNASLFEDDSAPYEYKENAWKWLDENVEWAKKYDIKLLLNMHIPQGGKLVASNTVFWEDSSYQDRFVALWKAIAQRYADDDVILGYGLLNEPFVLECSTPDEALDMYYGLIDRTVSAIRSVDENHMLFVERPYGTINPKTQSTKYVWGTVNSFREINDDNTVYEFHFYDMTDFTHQGLDWLPYTDKYVYNDDEIALLGGARKALQIYRDKALFTDTYSVSDSKQKWQHMESPLLSIENSNANYGYWIVYINNMASGSSMYIDNLVVKEYDGEGNYLRDIHITDFDTATACAGWDLGSNGGGKYSYNASAGVDGSGCAQITDASGSYRFYRNGGELNINFQLDPSHRYQVCADVQLENAGENVSLELGIQSAFCENVFSYNIDFLRYRLNVFLDYANAHNIPLYMGEFGVTRHVMNDEYQGDSWINDMFDLVNEYGLGYSYHDYHEQNFGLYINDSREIRGERNETLYNIFESKVN